MPVVPPSELPDWPNLPAMMLARAGEWPERPMLRFWREGEVTRHEVLRGDPSLVKRRDSEELRRRLRDGTPA